MFKKLALLLPMLGLTLAGWCQESPAPAEANPDTPTKEQVLQFLDLTHQRANLVQVMEGVKQSMKTGAEAGFRQRVASPSPEQLKKVDRLVDTIFESYPYDAMIDATVPIYQRHLSKSDLDGIVAFYSSPVGQKLLQEQPKMLTESMEAGRQIMLHKMSEMSQRLDQQLDELATSEVSKSKPAQPPVKKPLPGNRME